MSDIDRRKFLKLSGRSVAGTSAAAVAGGILAPTPAEAVGTNATLPYQQDVIGRASTLEIGVALNFDYPDGASPCVLLKTGVPALGGVGPNGDIVAFSILCTHMGCPVRYDSLSGAFKCPCHFTQFDPDKGGQMICGQATTSLPQIELRYDADDDTITASGVNGLIYGRQANVLD